MKRIFVAKHAGFCFGVKRAIAMAEETAEKARKEKGPECQVHSLGPIIHNPQAVGRLEEKGVRVVATADEVSCGKVIIRSHGATRSDRTALAEKKVSIVDATCPFVARAQEHVRELSREGYAIVVVGDERHPEVKSIISYIDKGVPVFTSLSELAAARGLRKVGIVSQTTQSFDNVAGFVVAALRVSNEVRVFNTICNATTLRQEESAALAAKVDAMFVLGGFNSANTCRLAEICREINARTYHVETPEELRAEMLEGAVSAGVTGGASTPQWLIDGSVDRLKTFWSAEETEVTFYR